MESAWPCQPCSSAGSVDIAPWTFAVLQVPAVFTLEQRVMLKAQIRLCQLFERWAASRLARSTIGRRILVVHSTSFSKKIVRAARSSHGLRDVTRKHSAAGARARCRRSTCTSPVSRKQRSGSFRRRRQLPPLSSSRSRRLPRSGQPAMVGGPAASATPPGTAAAPAAPRG